MCRSFFSEKRLNIFVRTLKNMKEANFVQLKNSNEHALKRCIIYIQDIVWAPLEHKYMVFGLYMPGGPKDILCQSLFRVLILWIKLKKYTRLKISRSKSLRKIGLSYPVILSFYHSQFWFNLYEIWYTSSSMWWLLKIQIFQFLLGHSQFSKWNPYHFQIYL